MPMDDPIGEQSGRAGDDAGLTHVDAAGQARMVDVSQKPWTRRRAVARCRVVLDEVDGFGLAPAGAVDKGWAGPEWAQILEDARLAGIQAAKQTSELIPLCHTLTSTKVSVTASAMGGLVEVESQAEVLGPTGVEMEALTACTIAGLTVLAVFIRDHPEATMDAVTLWEKSGGRSGSWKRAV
jgi:cyclic pyranopterin phosphate synthase